MVSKNWSQGSRYFSGSSSVVVLLGKIEVVHRVIATKSPRQAPTGSRQRRVCQFSVAQNR